jgi:hypothetical protein
VLSRPALTVAWVRQVDVGEDILVDPVEVADQARSGSGSSLAGGKSEDNWRSQPVSGSSCWKVASQTRADTEAE